MFYRGNNQALVQQLKQLKQRLPKIQSQTDFQALMDVVKQFSGSYQFHYKNYWLAVLAVVMAGTGLAYYDWLSLQQMQSTTWIIVAVSAVALLCLVGLMTYPLYLMTSVSKHLLQQDALLDNGIHPVSFRSAQLTEALLARFNEFHRGNYRREVKALYEGTYQGDEYAITYRYLHFHYVDERIVTETYTNSKGQVRTRRRRVYDHYDRYAVILPFQFTANVAVISFPNGHLNASTYQPASNRFNKVYRVAASEELAAAKAMTPAVVVALEELAELLTKPNLEFNRNGDLCLSFADSDMITAPSNARLSDFDAFMTAIEGQQTFTKLQRTLETVHYLMTRLDSNF